MPKLTRDDEKHRTLKTLKILDIKLRNQKITWGSAAQSCDDGIATMEPDFNDYRCVPKIGFRGTRKMSKFDPNKCNLITKCTKL